MRSINIDREWYFGTGMYNQRSTDRRKVNLPHDYMIESEVTPDAPAGAASGFYTASVCHYTKLMNIPSEWEGEEVYLSFDGVMMNGTVDINGCKAALQHYGYAPFSVNITPYIYFGCDNRVTLTVNPSMQPNSRWYTGAGIFRPVNLMHGPKVHIKPDGIYAFTERIENDPEGRAEAAFIRAELSLRNVTMQKRIALACIYLTEEGSGRVIASRTQKVQLEASSDGKAYFSFSLDCPELWSPENPHLYELHASVKDIGRFVTHLVEEDGPTDEAKILFGVRTVTADAKHGLRINGKETKLKGGCLHHDNGLLGAVSLYDSEARKVSILEKIGFNAIRTTHNPPSKALLDACDRLGMLVFDEAFDAWGIMKQPGDYNMFFESDWEKDLTAFITRDRSHPSVIMWSTGNEIPERGGLDNGYALAEKLARKVKELDGSRPVSNAICSFWSGLDEFLNAEQLRKLAEGTGIQNLDAPKEDLTWETYTEPFTNGLDIVGYNYMEDRYIQDHEMYPDRVILGSENFPKEIGFRWPLVMSEPYFIGDFTWTAWDYIGEAGIGKSIFTHADDPILREGATALMSHGSEFPWRLASDADVDINGNILPQGEYRSIVWGDTATGVYSYPPEAYGKVELLSMWGFTDVNRSWSYPGCEGKKINICVFSSAPEVEVFINGVSIGRKKQGESPATEGLPLSFVFDAVYEPGEVKAVSLKNGKAISEDVLVTAGEAYGLKLTAEKTSLSADGHSLAYISAEIVDEDGRPVPYAKSELYAEVSGAASLAGFGSSKPKTTDNYTDGHCFAYKGQACAIVRSGYESGEAILTVKADLGGRSVLGSVKITVE